MDAATWDRVEAVDRSIPFERIALLLQGGGALGAYQAGVYQALAEAHVEPNWVAGISIGAINAAIIAGNPRESRIDKLRAFWEGVSTQSTDPLVSWFASVAEGDFTRRVLNELSAFRTVMTGARGFFTPRPLSPWFVQPGAPAATSYYDTSPLRGTLQGLIDFERINSRELRFSVGAVNIRTGNFVYFDNHHDRIRVEHIMASGALPPGFGAVEIDGQCYWDGGLVSNTPLSWVLNATPRQNTLAFQVDLWASRGPIPGTMGDVAVRQKEIQYSSRTRAETDHFKSLQRARFALAGLLDKLPPELVEDKDVKYLSHVADRSKYNIIELVYRSKNYEDQSKDYEFSRLTMEDHWRSGYNDAARTLRHKDVFRLPRNNEGVFTFDISYDGRD